MHEIVEGVFLGGLVDASDVDLLQRAKIKAVLTCCMPFEFPVHARQADLEYCNVEVEDIGAENIAAFFVEAANFVESHVLRQLPVLIHCKSGISRSATIAMAYLIIKKNFYLQDAFFHVRLKRDIVCPNIGFMAQLCKLEKDLVNSDLGIDGRATSLNDRHFSNSSPLLRYVSPTSSPRTEVVKSSIASSTSIKKEEEALCRKKPPQTTVESNGSHFESAQQCASLLYPIATSSNLNSSSTCKLHHSSLQNFNTTTHTAAAAAATSTGSSTVPDYHIKISKSVELPIMSKGVDAQGLEFRNASLRSDELLLNDTLNGGLRVLHTPKRSRATGENGVSSHPVARTIEDTTADHKSQYHFRSPRFVSQDDCSRMPQISRHRIPSVCMDKYIDWYIADTADRAAVPDLDP